MSNGGDGGRPGGNGGGDAGGDGGRDAADDGGRHDSRYLTHIRVVHFAIFAITSRMLRILMEHIEIKNSLKSKLQTDLTHSLRVVCVLEVIA